MKFEIMGFSMEYGIEFDIGFWYWFWNDGA